MIQIAAGLPTLPVGPKGPVLLAAESGTSNFALALSTLIVPGAVAKALPGEAKLAELPAGERQATAEPGKELPEIGLDLSGDEEAPEQQAEADDDAPASEDLPFAWFAAPVAPAPEVTVTAPVDAPKAIVADTIVSEVILPEIAVPGEPALRAKPAIDTKALPVADPAISTAPRAAEPEAAPAIAASIAPEAKPLRYRVIDRPVAAAPRVTLRASTDPAPAATMPVPPAAMAAPTVAAPAVAAPIVAPATSAPVTAAPIDQPSLAVTAATVATAAPAAPQPAAVPVAQPVREAIPATVDVLAPRVQLTVPAAQPVAAVAPEQPLTVASLIAQASVQNVTQPVSFSPLRRSLAESDQPQVTSATTPTAAVLQQVAATPDAQQGALDMRRHEWTGKMVEMIEAMRDAAPVKETKISLMPEALGKLDISVRQDGDRVHVHFTAETQAARQILTDAQPRLNEIAEQRGIRLGQTSVDQQGAGAQSGQRQGDAPRNQTPSAPASARTANTTTDTDDERIA